MNTQIYRKKIIRFALRNSSFCRNKYYDMFYRKWRKDTKLLFADKLSIISIIDRVKLKPFEKTRFAHQIDDSFVCFYSKDVIGNMPPNYERVIKYSLNELLRSRSVENDIYVQNCEVIKAAYLYIDRIEERLIKDNPNDARINYFENMKYQRAKTLEDALQRILFWSSMFWQTGHKLIGLGRLDVLLDDIDLERDHEEVVAVLVDFLRELHRYYEYKSAELLGDIGQIIILGGKDLNSGYFCNRYTYEILEALAIAHVTDPKVLLRVSDYMPELLLKKAVECLSTSTGSPLFSNDDVIIPGLIEFGYDEVDAYNYVTSACWEPLSYGNSLEQNNLAHVKYAGVFAEVLKDVNVKKCETFEDFFEVYKNHLHNEINKELDRISTYEWNRDPLFTFFTERCLELGKDIAEGGAKYNNYGILSLGMANAVNSLMNVKKYVYDLHEYTLENLHEIWVSGNTDKINQIAIESAKFEKSFAHDDTSNIELTNSILNYTYTIIEKYRNKYDGKVKIGLSSPGYISQSTHTGATFDGRGVGQPVSVHISADDGVAYTELVSFASQLNYRGTGINGNVIDFFVSPQLLVQNKEKFCIFLSASIKMGFCQMQMNVLSSSDLIAAQKEPEKYKNLIVRVWGFSAYFIDIPMEYQNLLIERARASERIA